MEENGKERKIGGKERGRKFRRKFFNACHWCVLLPTSSGISNKHPGCHPFQLLFLLRHKVDGRITYIIILTNMSHCHLSHQVVCLMSRSLH